MIRNPQFERCEAVERLFLRVAPGYFVRGVGVLRAVSIGAQYARESLASGAADPVAGLGVDRDEAAPRIQKGLRILLRNPAPLPRHCARLKGRPEGEVTLVLRLESPEREIEIRLPGRYPVNPKASSAIKAIPGVAEVELV